MIRGGTGIQRFRPLVRPRPPRPRPRHPPGRQRPRSCPALRGAPVPTRRPRRAPPCRNPRQCPPRRSQGPGETRRDPPAGAGPHAGRALQHRGRPPGWPRHLGPRCPRPAPPRDSRRSTNRRKRPSSSPRHGRTPVVLVVPAAPLTLLPPGAGCIRLHGCARVHGGRPPAPGVVVGVGAAGLHVDVALFTLYLASPVFL